MTSPLRHPHLLPAIAMAAATLVLGACGDRASASSASPAAPATATAKPAAKPAPIRVATLQFYRLGKAGVERPAFADALAKLLTAADVVCLEGIAEPAAGEALAAVAGSGHAVILGQPSGPADDQEQSAIIYRTATISNLDGSMLSAKHGLSHPPLIAHLQATGGFTFALVVAHTDAAKAPAEISGLAEIVEEAKTATKDDDVVVVGGLNAGSDHLAAGQLEGQEIVDFGHFMWLTTPTMNSTLSNQADDRIIITANTQDEWTGKTGVEKLFTGAEGVSDHQPVWAEFAVAEAK